MYIGSTGQRGLHHLVYEILDNAIDEVQAGHATQVRLLRCRAHAGAARCCRPPLLLLRALPAAQRRSCWRRYAEVLLAKYGNKRKRRPGLHRCLWSWISAAAG